MSSVYEDDPFPGPVPSSFIPGVAAGGLEEKAFSISDYRGGFLVFLGSLGGVAQPRSLGHGSLSCPMTRELGHEDTACTASLLGSMGSLLSERSLPHSSARVSMSC